MPRSHAFTVVELLIVITIILTMMGLALGVWSNLGKNIARDVLANQIRDITNQASAQSLSTGLPYTITINAEDSTIQGTKQIRLLDESCDHFLDKNGSVSTFHYQDLLTGTTESRLEDESTEFAGAHFDTLPDPTIPTTTLGRFSYGWDLNGDEPSNSQRLLKPFQSPIPLLSERNKGFVMTCAVRAPAINDYQQVRKLTSPYIQVIPLLLLTATENNGTPSDNVDGAIAGLELWRQPQFKMVRFPTSGLSENQKYLPNRSFPYQYNPQETDPALIASQNLNDAKGYAHHDHWMLVGWVGQRPTNAPDIYDYEIGGLPPQKTDWFNFHQNTSNAPYVTDFVNGYNLPGEDPNNPPNRDSYLGGKWINVSLVFDGKFLSITRNNQLLARSNSAIPSSYIENHYNKTTHLWWGRHTTPASNRSQLATCQVDSLQLMSLGGGSAQSLPSGFFATDDYSITYIDGAPSGSNRQISFFDKTGNVNQQDTPDNISVTADSTLTYTIP